MPTYEYRCTGCGHHFELRQSFDEEPATTCPRCQGYVQRVIHAAPVIFKGSGFYTTDHRRSGVGTERDEVVEQGEPKPASEALSQQESSQSKDGGEKAAAS